MQTPRLFSLINVIAISLGATSARAQDVAGAKAMYERGMDALDKGAFDIACPSFAESHRLAAQAGTIFQWANCEDKAGKIASASTRYQLYLNEVKLLPAAKQVAHADRAKEAAARIAALSDEIPALTISLTGASPEGIVVKRDGIELTAISLGVAIPVDPGEHLVTAEMPNGRRIEQRVKVERKEKKAINIELAPPPSPPPPPPPPPPPVVKPLPSPPMVKPLPSIAPPPPAHPSGALLVGGFVSLGVGVVGLAVGSVTGGLAFDAKATFDKKCPNDACPSQADVDAWTQGRTMATISTVGFAVGLAGIGMGVVMLAVRRGNSDKVPANTGSYGLVVDMGPNGASLGVKGAF